MRVYCALSEALGLPATSFPLPTRSILELAQGVRLPSSGASWLDLREDKIPYLHHLSPDINDIIASMMRVSCHADLWGATTGTLTSPPFSLPYWAARLEPVIYHSHSGVHTHAHTHTRDSAVQHGCACWTWQADYTQRPTPQHLLQQRYFARSVGEDLCMERLRSNFYRTKLCTWLRWATPALRVCVGMVAGAGARVVARPPPLLAPHLLPNAPRLGSVCPVSLQWTRPEC
jgi:hypothetical protein